MTFPPFAPVGTIRPVAPARPGELEQVVAPSLTIEVAADPGEVEVAFVSGGDRLTGRYAAGVLSLAVTTGGRTTHHRSRRSGRPAGAVDRVALTLTGTRLAVMAREAGPEGDRWMVRGVADLRGRIDPYDEAWLAGVSAEGGALQGFGQLGLRDVRLVTHADGSPYRRRGREDEVLLTATSAGPGFFETAHTSVWSLDPGLDSELRLTHLSDVFFRRPDRPGAYGDHAGHLLRLPEGEGGGWLFATSTWGDFDAHDPDATVTATLAETDADLLTGRHLLDTRPLTLPTTGLRSVGVWDPHLVRTDDGWLAAYVSARRFFRFHPVLAGGPSLDRLALRGAASSLKQTEGPTLYRTDEGWVLLASDGDARRYPVFDLTLRQIDTLTAPYPSNIPWPTLVEHDDRLLLIGFDGTPVGGRVVGYGSHGAVQVAASRDLGPRPH